MDNIFINQLGRNLEVYVDDMVLKSTNTTSQAKDLAEIFPEIRKHNMRLNPKKCAFDVQGGKFLGFMLTHRGIKANPEKCVIIIETRIPNTLKKVQRLADRSVVPSKFLPREANTTKPIFKLLEKQGGTKWNEDCEANFQKLKEFLASPLILTRS